MKYSRPVGSDTTRDVYTINKDEETTYDSTETRKKKQLDPKSRCLRSRCVGVRRCVGVVVVRIRDKIDI